LQYGREWHNSEITAQRGVCARFGLCADCACKRPRRFNGRAQQANDSEEVSLNFDGQAAYLFHKIIDELRGHQENFEQEFRKAVVSPEASSRPAGN
jgi:hypothetical protein